MTNNAMPGVVTLTFARDGGQVMLNPQHMVSWVEGNAPNTTEVQILAAGFQRVHLEVKESMEEVACRFHAARQGGSTPAPGA